MARGGTKRGAKGIATPTASAVTTGTTTNPDPFVFVSKNSPLAAFASTLPKTHVFTIHADTTAASLKRQVFFVPVILNLIIIALLAWRVYYAAPIYLYQIITIFGYETSWTINTKETETGILFDETIRRTFLLMVDWALFFGLGRWPYEFVFGSKYSRYVGPVGWRWNAGFRGKEWIVRRSRKWHEGLVGLNAEQKAVKGNGGKWTKEEELQAQYTIEAGLRKTYTSKTGFTLLDKDWDLDFMAMVDLQDLFDAKELQEKDAEFDHVALLPWEGRWLCWYPYRKSEEGNSMMSVRDKRLERFKTKLVDIGCEDVFFRWIEIVQYETSLPNGFTDAKKSTALEEFQRMLRQRKRDYDSFVADIGGIDNIPGLEVSAT